jgi:hypothetical protein
VLELLDLRSGGEFMALAGATPLHPVGSGEAGLRRYEHLARAVPST